MQRLSKLTFPLFSSAKTLKVLRCFRYIFEQLKLYPSEIVVINYNIHKALVVGFGVWVLRTVKLAVVDTFFSLVDGFGYYVLDYWAGVALFASVFYCHVFRAEGNVLSAFWNTGV